MKQPKLCLLHIEASNRDFVIGKIIKTHNGYTDEALRDIQRFIQIWMKHGE